MTKPLLLLALLFGAGAARAQEYQPAYPPPSEPYAAAPPAGQEATSPFKRATVVVLHTADSASVAYTNLARLLLAAGYPIDKSDKELGYINTGFHVGQNKAVEQSLRAAIIPKKGGALIEIRGVYRMPSIGRGVMAGESPIECRGAFGSPAGISWQEMLRLASAYHAPRLAYK